MKQSINLSAFNNELNQASSCLHKNKPTLLQQNLPRNNQAKADFQQMQQERFKKAAEFVLSLSSLLMLSNGKGGQPTDLNTITAHVFKDAISYTAAGLHVDYRNVLVSHGSLPRGKLANTKAFMDNIFFTWYDNSAGNKERTRDRAILVAYCEALNLCLFNTWGARRRDEDAILEVPQFHGHKVHTWLSFISADGRSISNSMYAGSVTLSGFR
jgi:hypothetical protein